MTIEQTLRVAMQALRQTSDAPEIDAQRMLLYVFKQTEVNYLVLHGNDEVTTEQTAEFNLLLQDRIAGKPLAYILGQQGFYGRDFIVTPDVLIPRPDTEALIDAALTKISTLYEEKKRPLIIADLGTGSGCIAITLALEASNNIQNIIATDISKEALEVANANIKQFELEQIIELRQGDFLAAITTDEVDLIVSNPPYVPTAELEDLSSVEKRGLAYEPRQALDGGSNGVRYIAQLEHNPIPAIWEGIHGVIQKNY